MIRGRAPVRRDFGYGTEKQCTHCRGFWPEDREFFAVTGSNGRLSCRCRACEYELKHRIQPSNDLRMITGRTITSAHRRAT